MEQYGALRTKESEQAAELDTARDEAKTAMAAFNDLSGRRYDLFMGAFDHVAAHIDPIFKVLFNHVTPSKNDSLTAATRRLAACHECSAPWRQPVPSCASAAPHGLVGHPSAKSLLAACDASKSSMLQA